MRLLLQQMVPTGSHALCRGSSCLAVFVRIRRSGRRVERSLQCVWMRRAIVCSHERSSIGGMSRRKQQQHERLRLHGGRRCNRLASHALTCRCGVTCKHAAARRQDQALSTARLVRRSLDVVKPVEAEFFVFVQSLSSMGDGHGKQREMHYRNLSGGKSGSERSASTSRLKVELQQDENPTKYNILDNTAAQVSSNCAMAKSSRSSAIKKNNQNLKKKVFGPVETARNERQNAKLLELAQQPKPLKAEMEVEHEGISHFNFDRCRVVAADQLSSSR